MASIGEALPVAAGVGSLIVGLGAGGFAGGFVDRKASDTRKPLPLVGAAALTGGAAYGGWRLLAHLGTQGMRDYAAGGLATGTTVALSVMSLAAVCIGAQALMSPHRTLPALNQAGAQAGR